MKMLAVIKKCVIFVIIRLSQNTMIIQKKLVIEKVKDEPAVLRLRTLLN